MISLIKSNKVIAGVIGLVVIVLITYFGFIRNNSKVETIFATKATIKQSVNLTGKVKPVTEAQLAFNQSGRVVAVPVQVSDKVRKGDLLIQLDSAEAGANLGQAQGSLVATQAKLAEMKKGTRSEELATAMDKLTNAERDQSTARDSLLSACRGAYSKADDAVRNKVDQLFYSPRTYPYLTFNIDDSNLNAKIVANRSLIEANFITWEKQLNQGVSTSTENNLLIVKDFLDQLSTALNSLSITYSLPFTTVTNAKTELASARSAVSTAIDSFNAAKSVFNAADSALVAARNDLNLKQAGNTLEQIQAQEAAVTQAEAARSAAEARLSQLSLRSPIDGIVTRQEAKVGELITSNVIVAAVISDGIFEVEANVPEIDVAKLSLGNKGKATLDAYGDSLEFPVTLIRIDPAETILEGIPTYKIVLTFDQSSDKIRSGLTANLTIDGLSKANVLVISASAITIREGNKYVMVKDGGKMVERQIKTGLAGQEGLIEVIDGLQIGDEILKNPSI